MRELNQWEVAHISGAEGTFKEDHPYIASYLKSAGSWAIAGAVVNTIVANKLVINTRQVTGLAYYKFLGQSGAEGAILGALGAAASMVYAWGTQSLLD